jgi:hypothetical protein
MSAFDFLTYAFCANHGDEMQAIRREEAETAKARSKFMGRTCLAIASV